MIHGYPIIPIVVRVMLMMLFDKIIIFMNQLQKRIFLLEPDTIYSPSQSIEKPLFLLCFIFNDIFPHKLTHIDSFSNYSSYCSLQTTQFSEVHIRRA
mmetsp:Transcript_25438/g.58689  ORF Transcript_25438/g.58689 Transcript_25438/m.58689 type:complete len:97 (-) Transcript_25438:39-329(-)